MRKTTHHPLRTHTYGTYIQLLQMLKQIKNGFFQTIPDIAGVLEVSDREVRRHMESLKNAGVPLAIKNGTIGFSDSFSLLPCIRFPQAVLQAVGKAFNFAVTKAPSLAGRLMRLMQELQSAPDLDAVLSGQRPDSELSAIDRLSIWDRLIKQKKYPTADKVAQICGISTKTAHRDSTDLQTLGLSAEFSIENDGYFYADPSHYVASAVVTQREIGALRAIASLMATESDITAKCDAAKIAGLAKALANTAEEYRHRTCFESTVEEAAAICAAMDKLHTSRTFHPSRSMAA